MNHHTPGDNLSVINRSNLHANHYTKSLIQEALRVHLFTPAEVDDLHMQIMGQLEQLLRRRTSRGPSTRCERIATGNLFFLRHSAFGAS